MTFAGEYTPPTLTVDAVVLRLHGAALEVLLVRRSPELSKGSGALPGGYNAAGQTTLDAWLATA